MTKEEITSIKRGLGRALLKSPGNQILKDFEAVLLTLEAERARNSELLKLLHNTKLAYCQEACKNYPLADPRKSEHTKFCLDVSDYILREPQPTCEVCKFGCPHPCACRCHTLAVKSGKCRCPNYISTQDGKCNACGLDI